MIKLENVHKSFGKNEVLKGINLHIKQGQVVVIIGPVSYTHLSHSVLKG